MKTNTHTISQERTSIHPSGDLALVVQRMKEKRWRLEHDGEMYPARLVQAGDRFQRQVLLADVVAIFDEESRLVRTFSIAEVLEITGPKNEAPSRPS